MRVARLVLLLCLTVGLSVIAWAARADLLGARASARSNLERVARAELRLTAREEFDWLSRTLPEQPVIARYDLAGRLQRPAPPSRARAWEPPVATESALFLRAGKNAEALARARDSRDRAAAKLARATKGRDAALLREALAEQALAGTDLRLRARLELFRLEGEPPDEEWIDDVSALLDGPSDRLGRALLNEAGVDPVGDRGLRRDLAGLRPRAGVFLGRVGEDRFLGLAAEEQGGLALHALWMVDLEWAKLVAETREGDGVLLAALPGPFDMLAVSSRVPPGELRDALRDEWTRLLVVYSAAALVLLAGSAYAYHAMGRAVKLARAKSDFVANVTHELKTPLANIRLYVETLRAGRAKAEDHAEFLGTILDEAERLDALVEGLLHAARGPRLRMARVDCGALLEEVAANWQPRLEREGFELRLVTAAELPFVRGDREALRRAMDNLVDNARKYGAGDKRIELGGEARNGEVRLSVRDHGPGIPEGERTRVLQPFHRLESADRKETAGTGLGLSLVVAVMDAHGGRISIGGAPGGGAILTLILRAENPA